MISEETRRKMSESQKKRCKDPNEIKRRSEASKGKTFSEETRQKIGKAIKERNEKNGHPMKGKYHSEETKQKISKANKGKKCKPISEETKRKISEANKGRIVSKMTRKKLSESLKGHDVSEETKAKLSNATKKYYENNAGYWLGKKLSKKHKQKLNGRKLSEEMKQKMSEDKKEFFKNNPEARRKLSEIAKKQFEDPRNHPSWKGGISCEPYCQIWSDDEYKEDLKERDGNQCLNPDCWSNSNTICLHHIDYDKKNCHPWNLITVCISCNGRANKNRKKHEIFYKQIMNELYGYEYETELTLLSDSSKV